MNKKFVCLALAAVVGFMSFLPSMSVSASYYQSVCSVCGEYASIDTVIDTERNWVASIICPHGYEGMDNYYELVDIVEFYCTDCDRTWEEEHVSGTLIDCCGDW